MANYSPHLKKPLAGLTIAALGVVYGDIGTSPLYAAKETFNPDHGIALNTANSDIYGITITGSITGATNTGGGPGGGGAYGGLDPALLVAGHLAAGAAQAIHQLERVQRSLSAQTVQRPDEQDLEAPALGVFGASLFYGDAVLTPAISVLSAVEGLAVGTAAFKPYVVPIAVGVVIGLFAVQRRGTSLVGALFGPVALVWFLALAALGIRGIASAPEVLWAFDPLHAIGFVTEHGYSSFVVLGAVLLAFTGAEALYADMGHFGKAPIRIAWFGLVFPALVLNYFGQGALLISNPKTLDNPFYLLAPDWALYPMVALATAATVIASQATISGTYSLTKQAIQLDYLPRMDVTQTSSRQIGQIYIRGANWVLLFVIIIAIIGFGSSTRLASAYGVAVTGTMLVTTILTFFVIRFAWHYSLFLSIAATAFFIFIDTAFFSSSLLKVAEGGWFPLALGAIVFTVMTTWHRGRQLAMAAQKGSGTPISSFLDSLARLPVTRVPGTAMFMAGNADAVPRPLLRNFACNKVLHERVVLLTVVFRDIPWVTAKERVKVEPLRHDFYRVIIYFGFMDRPDVSQALFHCEEHGLPLDPLQTWFLLSRATIVPTPGAGMAMWRERLFAAMGRHARTAGDYFNIPAGQVIELGTKIEI